MRRIIRTIRFTLLLSSMALPARRAARRRTRRRRGWGVTSLDRNAAPPPQETEIVFYGSTLEAVRVAERFDLALLEPPLDLLTRLPPSLLLRRVGYGRWGDVEEFSHPVFLKPADPLAKVFDAGVYRGRGQIRSPAPFAAGHARADGRARGMACGVPLFHPGAEVARQFALPELLLATRPFLGAPHWLKFRCTLAGFFSVFAINPLAPLLFSAVQTVGVIVPTGPAPLQ